MPTCAAGAALAAPLLQAQPAAADTNIQTVTKTILKENLGSQQRNGILKELVVGPLEASRLRANSAPGCAEEAALCPAPNARCLVG